MSSSTTDTDKAITIMLFVMRSQLFLDGDMSEIKHLIATHCLIGL